MQAPKESSVLFALDELRDIEEIRNRDLREVARKQAKERAKESARIADEEDRKRLEAEREASEIVQLRTQRDDDARSRRILQAQLAADAQTNASLQSRLRMMEATAAQPSAALVEQGKSNRIHAAWAMALVATMGAFMLLMGQREEAPVLATAGPVATEIQPALVPAANCPTPEPSPVVASVPDAAPTPETKRPRPGTKKPPRKDPKIVPIDISACGDDPLACMPK